MKTVRTCKIEWKESVCEREKDREYQVKLNKRMIFVRSGSRSCTLHTLLNGHSVFGNRIVVKCNGAICRTAHFFLFCPAWLYKTGNEIANIISWNVIKYHLTLYYNIKHVCLCVCKMCTYRITYKVYARHDACVRTQIVHWYLFMKLQMALNLRSVFACIFRIESHLVRYMH